MCERRDRVGERWYNLRPDALAEYPVGERHLRFWLEWDRGTMNARDLATKFHSYTQYIDSREWTKEWSMLPLLVCIAPDIVLEKRMLRVAQTCLSHVHGLVLLMTTEVLLKEYGPLAPIWVQTIQQGNQMLQLGPCQREIS